LERRRRQVNVVVAAARAPIHDPDLDRLAAPAHVRRLAARLAVVRVAVYERTEPCPEDAMVRCNWSARSRERMRTPRLDPRVPIASAAEALGIALTDHHLLEQSRADGSDPLVIAILPPARASAGGWVV
jgi:hypothetical protein